MNPLVMIDMKSKLKGKVENTLNKGYTQESKMNEFDISNLNITESDFIKEIIQGDKKVVEKKKCNTIISLDEAVNKIKNSR